jgi:enoyl-CoA hydratase/carnithine racemase
VTSSTNAINPRSFLYHERGAVATITFNRPDRLNSLTFDVYRELIEVFAALRARDSVRVVVIAGQGRGFCSGGDVEDIIGELFSRDMSGLLEFTRMTCELIRNIRALHKPVIASLNDMGAAFLLPKVVGLSQATEMLYTGDFVSAADALRIGLYNRVVAAGELEAETAQWAERLAAGPGFALAMTKAALNRELHMSLEAALEAEAEAQAICMLNPDFREAFEAFREKRKPEFNQTMNAER